MTEQYSQTVELEVPSKIKRTQLLGIAFILFAIGAFAAAVILSWYILIAFGAFVASAAVCIHIYNATAKEFIYDYSSARLVIAKCDLVNCRKRMLSVMFDDVRELSAFDDMLDEANDINVCKNAYDMGVWQMVFDCDGRTKRVLFSPDDYLLALLKERLADKYVPQERSGDVYY